MKQFQITYDNDKAFYKELEHINQWRARNVAHATVFRIYTEDLDLDNVRHVCNIIESQMPDALYLGCTSNSNIIDGVLSDHKISMTCTIFEDESTQVKILNFPFSESNGKEVVAELKKYCDENPWVSAVEIHATVLGISVKEFCDEMGSLRSDIQVFGGGAFAPNVDTRFTAVFSKGKGFSSSGIVFLLLGGENLHTYSTYISGWKPLKRRFKVTKAEKSILYELDGQPAFSVYKKFLNLENSNNLVANTIEFPLSMEDNGIDVLRCLWQVNDDNSIIMVADVVEGVDVKLAYGDPQTILSSIRHDGQKIANFRPEGIQIFTCASRRSFWGDDNVSDETILFNSIAPATGFYTSGEFLRVKGVVHNFNTTLVLVAMREGEPKTERVVNIYDAKLDNIDSDKVPLIRRFVAFIDASTAELEELNRKLILASITDGLTKLYNRSEIERRIRHTVDSRKEACQAANLCLIMLDIDNFKKVNDAYGHMEGDGVIVAMSDVLRKVMESTQNFFLGRWGGEEFMVLLPDCKMNEAAKIAEKIRAEFAAATFAHAPSQTVSIGVIEAKEGEDADALYSRVDEALYKAKTSGKNKVVKLR